MQKTPKKDIYNQTGTVLKNRFEILEFVDEGGMGIVYKAKDYETSNFVAVKILPPRFLTAQERAETYLNLFRKEADVLEKLHHPNIVSIIDSGIDNETVFIVMEWLEGTTLGKELLTKGKFTAEKTAQILKQICIALRTAHRKKIIHLDLKPNNIFLTNVGTPNENIKIIDFGLARIIQSTLGSTISRVVGTPQYMAPEVFENKASHLSDIYSLGVLTYEMLTGLLPFSNSHIYALMRDQINQPAPSVRKIDSNIPELIDSLIKTSLNKLPKSRPQSVQEFSDEFSRALLVVDNVQNKVKQNSPSLFVDKPYLSTSKKALMNKILLPTVLAAVFCSVFIFFILGNILSVYEITLVSGNLPIWVEGTLFLISGIGSVLISSYVLSIIEYRNPKYKVHITIKLILWLSLLPLILVIIPMLIIFLPVLVLIYFFDRFFGEK